MHDRYDMRDHLAERNIGEVPIRDMDRSQSLLVDERGRRYHEINTNIWARTDGGLRDVVYLGTGRHGGGITLRPLYVKVEGVWRNATTGREAPADMPYPRKTGVPYERTADDAGGASAR